MISEIRKRYEKESAGCGNLSCGGNIRYLGIKPGEIILDLGCGRGGETIEAARLCGPDGEAVGLDITPAMIDTARKSAQAAGAANTRFVFGDIEGLPFGDGAFDAVMSNCVINHARDKSKVYKEIMRVLKKGGRFVISDAVTKTALPEKVRNDPEAWAQCFGGAITEGEYFESVVKSGFGKIEVLRRREYIKNGYDFISLTIYAVKR